MPADRVSVVRFCSARVDLIDFSDQMLRENAGTDAFDYILVTWNASPELLAWIAERPHVLHREYVPDPKLAYVPNLRRMFCFGFEQGYELNDWVTICDADMAFAPGWLWWLMRYAEERVIPNSVHVSPIRGVHVVTANLGEPTAESFNLEEFKHIVLDQSGRPRRLSDRETGDWQMCATLPYVLHRSLWETYGPWEFECGTDPMPPDRRFFRRCHEAGVEFVLAGKSVVYHHEATERRGPRPKGLEYYPEGR